MRHQDRPAVEALPGAGFSDRAAARVAAVGALPGCERPGAAVSPDAHLARGDRVALGERAAADLVDASLALVHAARGHAAAVVVLGRHAVADPPVQATRAAG